MFTEEIHSSCPPLLGLRVPVCRSTNMKPTSLWVCSLVSVSLIVMFFCLSSHSTAYSNYTPSRRNQLSLREKRQVVDTYYDFLINEWSFKFWAVFQLVTIAILLYSTFAAIYYAKYTYLRTQPSEEDIFLRKRALDAGTLRWGEG